MTLTGSSQTVTVKYVIHSKFEIEGVVEKPDVIGAVFGQTEGLFGPELDLRELQKSGRIGRIKIDLHSEKDKTTGAIQIPTSLNRVSTAIISASLESINRVGPCAAKVTLEKIEDVRDARRKIVVARAKEILHKWTVETLPSTEEIYQEVAETLKAAKAEKYGPEELTSGPNIEDEDEIIIVEGRADVINMLRCGIENVIALEGAKIPETIIKLCKEKASTAFLDGDRGGTLIMKELLQVTNVKNVARAPQGREVEDLNCLEIFRALEQSESTEKFRSKEAKRRAAAPKEIKVAAPKKIKVAVPKEIVQLSKKLEGTLEGVLLSENMEEISRLPVSKLAEKLQESSKVDTVVFDGVITQRMVDIASEKNVKCLVAARISDAVKQPLKLSLLTFRNLNSS